MCKTFPSQIRPNPCKSVLQVFLQTPLKSPKNKEDARISIHPSSLSNVIRSGLGEH